MAVTSGHGNPKWTREEVILALELYFECGERIPSAEDPRVRSLSELLRAFPHHSEAARKESFRNPDGVAFKLQNLRQVATGIERGDIESLGLGFYKKLELLALLHRGDSECFVRVREHVVKLNKLRNRLAHRLMFENGAEELGEWAAQVLAEFPKTKFTKHTYRTKVVHAFASVASELAALAELRPNPMLQRTAKWHDASEGDSASYRSSSGGEQLTIGYYPAKKPMSADERRAVLERMVDIYRQSEVEQPESSATTGETKFSEWRGILRADFAGVEKARSREFARAIVASNAYVLSIYLESVENSGEAFTARNRSIVESLKLP